MTEAPTKPSNHAPLFVVALFVACALDLAVVRAPISWRFLIALFGLAIAWGAALGFSWQLSRWGLSRMRALPRVALAVVVCSSVAGVFAYRLGVFRLLGERQGATALVALGGCAVFGLALAASLLVVTPIGERHDGYLAGLPERWRLAFGGAAMVAAATLVAVDRVVLPGGYETGHVALRLAAIVAFVMGMAAVVPTRALSRVPMWAAPVGIALGAALGGLLVDASKVDTLVRFDEHAWPRSLLTLSRGLADRDGDGHATILGDHDCDDGDAARNPSAYDVPANGVDENCMFGDAAPPAELRPLPPPPSAPPPLDVVLITVDSLRADRTTLYPGGVSGRATTPHLGAWAREATVFERAYSPGSRTGITFYSIMTGLYARHLQWGTEPLVLEGQTETRRALEGRASPAHWLPSRMRRRGLTTIAIVNDDFTQYFRPGSQMSRGFDVLVRDDDVAGRDVAARDPLVVRRAARMLREAPSDHRIFVWVHLYDLHTPVHLRAGEVPRYGSDPLDVYDHEVRAADEHVGILLKAIEEARPRAAVFVTSDHGESITALGRVHGFDLAEEVMRIPLVARVPGWPVGRVQSPVSLVDLAPTILALTGSAPPPSTDGVDLARLAKADSAHDRVVLSDSFLSAPEEGLRVDMARATTRERAVAWDRKRSSFREIMTDGLPVLGRRLPASAEGDPLVARLLRYGETASPMFH